MQRIATAQECVSDFVLNGWYSDELSAAELERVQTHLATCAACRERQRLMFDEHDRYLETAPNFSALANLAARTKRSTPTRRHRFAGAMPLFAGAALAAGALLMLWKPAETATHYVRAKGESHLGVYIKLKRSDHVVRGKARNVVQPGDRLRFTYTTAHPSYLAILGLDERTATSYFPSQPNAAPVAEGMEVPLDFAVELDTQLGTETIYALFCPASFAVEPVRKALAEQRKLARPSDACSVSVLSLQKVAAP